MQSSTQRIVKNTLFLYIRQIFVLIVGLFITRLTLQLLGVTDYGVYSAAAGLTTLLSILTSALTSSTMRFVTVSLANKDVKESNTVYITSIHIHILFSILLLVVGETIGLWFLKTQMVIPVERMSIAFWVYQFSLFNCIFNLINVPNDAEILAHEDMGVISIMSIGQVVFKLLFVWILIYIPWDKLLWYAIALFIISLSRRYFCLWYCKTNYEEVNYHFIWNKALFKQMIGFSGWSGLAELSVMGFTQGANILLNLFFGPLLNAAYAVAMQAYTGIWNFCNSFQSASNPQIIKLYSTGELSRMHKLLFSVCKMSFFLIYLLSFPILINADFILSLWLDRVPVYTTSFFVLIIIYGYINVFSGPFRAAVQASGNVKKYFTTLSILILLPLPIAYICYTYDMKADTIFYFAILMASICLVVRIKILSVIIGFKQSVFYKDTILRLVITIIISSIMPILFRIYTEVNLLSVAISFLMSYLIMIPLVYKIGLNYDERTFILSLKRKFIQRTSI